MRYIIQMRYRSGGRWFYAYINNRMNLTTERRNAARFNRLDNAEDVARILSKHYTKHCTKHNTEYEGRVQPE